MSGKTQKTVPVILGSFGFWVSHTIYIVTGYYLLRSMGAYLGGARPDLSHVVVRNQPNRGEGGMCQTEYYYVHGIRSNYYWPSCAGGGALLPRHYNLNANEGLFFIEN